ncbi:hypothetical protein ACFPL7_23610 [Dongia soli]|uniref:hypothetical protein n=1 Tax=Dongia soli TaxID=600628 RepID=UPI003609F2E5
MCGLQTVSRTSILADTAPFFRRHGRRFWVVARNAWSCRDLYRRSFRYARQSGQETVWDLAKVSWNLWTVIALIAEGERRQGTTVIVDQGLLQAIWSVQLTATQPFSPELWKDLLLATGIRRALIANIHTDIKIAHIRASTRNSNGSRLTDRPWRDLERQWEAAAHTVADLVKLVRELADSDDSGGHILKVENVDVPPEEAAREIASALLQNRVHGKQIQSRTDLMA